MTMRLMNLIVYAALAALSILVIRSVSGIAVNMPGDVGSGFFPAMLSWLVLALSALGAARCVLAGAGGSFATDYLPRVLATIAVTAAFLLSWQSFGLFYIQAFVFLFGLFTYYRIPRGVSAYQLGLNAAVAGGITLVCYVTFTFLVYVDL